MHLSYGFWLSNDSFTQWGKKLALQLQQYLVERFDNFDIKLSTEGKHEDSNFAYKVDIVATGKNAAEMRRTFRLTGLTIYIYPDQVIVDNDYLQLSHYTSYEALRGEIMDSIFQYFHFLDQKTFVEGKLDEKVNLKGAVAAGAVAAAALIGGSSDVEKHDNQARAEQDSELKRKQNSFKAFSAKQDNRVKDLADTVTKKYKVKPDLAVKVVKLAIKYEKPTFPKAEDILSVIGVESAFKPQAVSALKKDPAVGLMQVRPGVWKLDGAELLNSMDKQVKVGSDILHGYYKKLKSEDAALQAYNIGITNYMKQQGLNPRYVPKVKAELKMYEGLKHDLFQLQQDLIELDDSFDYDIFDKNGIMVSWEGNDLLQINVGSLEPFNVTTQMLHEPTYDPIDRSVKRRHTTASQSFGINGYGAWDKREPWTDYMVRSLGTFNRGKHDWIKPKP